MRSFATKVYIGCIVGFMGIVAPQLSSAYDSDSQDEASKTSVPLCGLQESYAAERYSWADSEVDDEEEIYDCCAPENSTLRRIIQGTTIGLCLMTPIILNYALGWMQVDPIKMTDIHGNSFVLPLTSQTGDLKNILATLSATNHSLSVFRYRDDSVGCDLTCIDGLSGQCETSFFRNHVDGQWQRNSSGDCWPFVGSHTSKLTNIAWTEGMVFTMFDMAKRALGLSSNKTD